MVKDKERLSSWKEIANYLDCDVRICRRWEKKYGLPVHRIDKESNVRVFAYKNELDQYIKNKSESKIFPAKKQKSTILYFLLPCVGILALIIYFFIPNTSAASSPEDFRIENSTLFITDKKGTELWEFPTLIENLLGENEYRKHFQYRKIDKTIRRVFLPQLIIKDINNNGKKEVLFSIQTQSELGEGKIFCFDSVGNKLWEFKAGKELKFGSTTYSPDYRIWGFDVVDLDADNKLEIVIISEHNDDFPTQLVVLDTDGKIQNEYWNSGRISDFAFEDLNGDGLKEIILAAMNNEYNKAVLIVFEADFIQGASPQSGKFRCESLPPGTEKYYVLLPRTDVDRFPFNYEHVFMVNILENRRISAVTFKSMIYFEFGFDLNLLDIRLSHSFMRMHEKAVREGKANSVLDEAYKKNLRDNVLYFDGKDWVSEISMNRN